MVYFTRLQKATQDKGLAPNPVAITFPPAISEPSTFAKIKRFRTWPSGPELAAVWTAVDAHGRTRCGSSVERCNRASHGRELETGRGSIAIEYGTLSSGRGSDAIVASET